MYIAKLGYIIVSIVLAFFGLGLIFNENYATNKLGIICAIIMVLFGVVKLVAYYSKDLYRLAFQFDFEFGILSLIIGLFMVIHKNFAIMHLAMIVAIVILADALFKIRIILEAKEFGIVTWFLSLICDAIVIILCNCVFFVPMELMIKVFGLALIATAALNLSIALAMVKIVKHQCLEEEKVNYRK